MPGLQTFDARQCLQGAGTQIGQVQGNAALLNHSTVNIHLQIDGETAQLLLQAIARLLPAAVQQLPPAPMA